MLPRMLPSVVLLATLSIHVSDANTAATPPNNFSWAAGLGQHRAIITLPPSHAPHGTAAFATVLWQRRPVPPTNTTAAVLTIAATGEVVGNAVRAPAGPGISDSEALIFVFEPTAPGDGPSPPSPPPTADGWQLNTGTAARSILTGCSGQSSGDNQCWKAVDGKMEFNDAGGGEGWDGKPDTKHGAGVEWLELDLCPSSSSSSSSSGVSLPGSAEAAPVTKFGLYSVSKADDRQWFPVHNPAAVMLLARGSTSGSWKEVYNGTVQADPEVTPRPRPPSTPAPCVRSGSWLF